MLLSHQYPGWPALTTAAPAAPLANIQGTLGVSELLKVLDQGGYSATTLVVQ